MAAYLSIIFPGSLSQSFKAAFISLGMYSLLISIAVGANDEMTDKHENLIREIQEDFLSTSPYTGIKAMSPKVEAAIRAVKRHQFVQEQHQSVAYINRPLPIGREQTISQPYIVALMTELITPSSGHKVLEIGTGSGYQAAVLAELVSEVYSIEIIGSLAKMAKQRLKDLGYQNVRVRHGDGTLGWESQAPFDAILVTAGGTVPPALRQQLKIGGKLVIPVDVVGGQELRLIRKTARDEFEEQTILPVRFVPLTNDVKD